MTKYLVKLLSFPGESTIVEAGYHPCVEKKTGRLQFFDEKNSIIAEFVNWSNWTVVKEQNG